mmetsp:Transcript_4045/g.12484  ORF Transcript_4045/g.12484 Transcript_4045/m.12484 type:complete len:255 (+) Transcript_4045:167-931(+)
MRLRPQPQCKSVQQQRRPAGQSESPTLLRMPLSRPTAPEHRPPSPRAASHPSCTTRSRCLCPSATIAASSTGSSHRKAQSRPRRCRCRRPHPASTPTRRRRLPTLQPRRRLWRRVRQRARRMPSLRSSNGGQRLRAWRRRRRVLITSASDSRAGRSGITGPSSRSTLPPTARACARSMCAGCAGSSSTTTRAARRGNGSTPSTTRRPPRTCAGWPGWTASRSSRPASHSRPWSSSWRCSPPVRPRGRYLPATPR